MSDKLEHMLEKAKAKRGRQHAPDQILIACERPEDVLRRVDVLIAARHAHRGRPAALRLLAR